MDSSEQESNHSATEFNFHYFKVLQVKESTTKIDVHEGKIRWKIRVGDNTGTIEVSNSD